MAGRMVPALAVSVATEADRDFAGAPVDRNPLIGVCAENWSRPGSDSSPGMGPALAVSMPAPTPNP